jgi:hypothetical protein
MIKIKKGISYKLIQWTSIFWEIIIIIGVVTLFLHWFKNEFPNGHWGDLESKGVI